MTPFPPPPGPPADPPRDKSPFVWRCGVCSRREEFGADEMGRFLADGWPECCGQKVLCYLPAHEPGRGRGPPPPG